jgi:transposase InsO family protein
VVLRDRDCKYSQALDGALEGAGVTTKKVYCSPNMNAYIERFVQTIQQECLDRFVCFGQEHLDHVVGEFVEHYHLERPPPGDGQRAAVRRAEGTAALDRGEAACSERLGGVLRHY